MATTDTKFNRITALETAQGSGELESSQAVDVERLRGRGMIEMTPVRHFNYAISLRKQPRHCG